jgi:sugar phosphate isomerase/epimerase
VCHVHLRDTTADQLQVKVGLGEIDYSRLINQLRRFESEIALSVDLVPALIGDEDRELEMRKLRMLLETLL